MVSRTFLFAGSALAAGLLASTGAQAEATQGQATAVVREGVAVRASAFQNRRPRPGPEIDVATLRTVTRPCDPIEPAISCRLVLIEMQ